jgi:virulence-associated protein VagC
MSATNADPKPQFDADSEPPRTAKLFKNGRSQAVRLPKEFRFEGTEVAIRRDETSGDVTLSPSIAPAPPRKNLQELLDLCDSHQLSVEDFEIEVRKLGKLTMQELFQLSDWAKFPEGFFEREVHMPRELDLF